MKTILAAILSISVAASVACAGDTVFLEAEQDLQSLMARGVGKEATAGDAR